MAEGRADTPGLIDPAIEWSVGEASPSGLAYFGSSLWFTTSNRDGRGSPRDGDDQILQYRP